MGVKITNNASGTLAAAITSGATTLTLTSGQGALFPTLGVGDYCWCTLVDTSNNVEIIKVTARSTDTLTMTRGQDNTTARAFAINDRLELRPTAALFAEFADNLPLAGGTMTGTIAGFESTGIDDNATSTAITIDASDNVGIGVVPESDWVSSRKVIQLNTTGSLAAFGDGIDLGENYKSTSGGDKYITTSQASKYRLNDGKFLWQVAPSGTADSAISWTTAMTIDNDTSGTVNIGYQSPSAGNAHLKVSSRDGRHLIDVECHYTSAYTMMALYNGNGWVGSIVTSGSATSYNTSSDYRLKENVVPMTGSIDRLKDLKPSRFNFKADTETTVDGFLAHEAGEVVPECATGDKDAMRDEEYEVTPAVMDGETVVTEAVMGTRSVPDYQGIDQSKLVPLLVASLQEAVAKIEALEARVTALEV